ncbi:anti-sigma factor ChrR (cupin superfamily) [Mycoplana sp. BE70]|nr:anti-sigma factor ChrR (cupin superfamily) [Mycoplana sp. BE70]
MSRTDTVIGRALAEVAASRALRERILARRAEAQKQTEAPPPVYVLRKGTQLRLPLQ